MIVKDKNGNDCNLEKLWGIEINFHIDKHGFSEHNWVNHKRYKSQRRMLQALKDIGKIKHFASYTDMQGNLITITFHFRPVHVNYNLIK